jgi:hypothetical protein
MRRGDSRKSGWHGGGELCDGCRVVGVSTVSAERGTAFFEKFAEDGTVAAIFVGAITAKGEAGLVGESREEVEEARSVGVAHLRAKAAFEGTPGAGFVLRAFVLRRLGILEERCGRGEIGQPDIVEVAFGEVGFGNAARRAADGAEAEAFVGLAR